MNDYISREAAVALAMEYCTDDDGSCPKAGHDLRELLDDLENAPPADVRPVVHGKWTHETIDTHRSITGKVFLPSAICSICGNSTIMEVNFCPFCGADMREEVPGHE